MLTLSSYHVAQTPAARATLTCVAGPSNIECLGTLMLYARNTEIYGDKEQAAYIYQVVSGAVRTHKMLNDGRRQIGGFYFPGDIFGLEFDEHHEFSAEAIC